MVKPLSQDLLDFLAGPWSTCANRFYRVMLAWQASLPVRMPVATEEIQHMLDAMAAIAALSAHVVWLTSGKDIEIPEDPSLPLA